MMKSLIALIETGYKLLIIAATWLQSVFLLIIRLYWGWQFHTTGLGKLMNLAKVSDYFKTLHIPFPTFNAALAGSAECFGGLCLLVGFCSRVFAVPLIITMMVAYWTAGHDAVINIFKDPDNFIAQDPFLFLLTAVIVFLFGPGWLSLDGAILAIRKYRTAKKKEATAQPAAAS
jgi:putative oxidoreductase